MKRSVLKSFWASLIFFNALNCLAQTSLYHPFPDSNAIWREFRWGGDGGLYQYEWEEQKFITGDTVVGNVVYKKIYESGFFTRYLNQNYDTSYYYYNNVAGYIREDSTKKIYRLGFTDELLYDFNLQLGDTIPESINHPQGNIITISNIDSIFDGTAYRTRFFLSTNGFSDYNSIIEGIGSVWGLFTLLDPPFESGGILHCFIENDTIKYTDSLSNSCNIVDDLNSIQDINAVSFTPNPSTSSVRIICERCISEKSVLVKILNSFGAEIKSEKIDTLSNYILDMSTLSAGIYYCEILSGSTIFRGEIILIK